MVPRSTHTVTASDGVSISLDRYGDGAGAVVVVCHGFFNNKQTPAYRLLGEALAKGRDVICMDFRGHGRSDGFYTFSAREGADLHAVLQWAAERYQRIGVIGFSLGGAIAINTAGQNHVPIHSLVAVSAPSAFEAIEMQYWRLRAIRSGIRSVLAGGGCRPGNLFCRKLRPVESITALRSLPTLFIHGTHDVIIFPRHSERLYAAAPEPKRLEILERGGHAETLLRTHRERLLQMVDDWYRQTLDT